MTFDHLPAETIFDKRDRVPLKMPAHWHCNNANSTADQRFGQLIGLTRGYLPSDPADQHLKITVFSATGLAAITNLEIKSEVWRWVRGFHAALYREPCPREARHAIETPFPSAKLVDGTPFYEGVRRQHRHFVQVIKENRFRRNLDRLHCNNGKMRYECVWVQSDNNGPWMCVFALNIEGWKEIGGSALFRKRGCAGFYVLPSGTTPTMAAKGERMRIIIPNFDQYDAFAP